MKPLSDDEALALIEIARKDFDKAFPFAITGLGGIKFVFIPSDPKDSGFSCRRRSIECMYSSLPSWGAWGAEEEVFNEHYPELCEEDVQNHFIGIAAVGHNNITTFTLRTQRKFAELLQLQNPEYVKEIMAQKEFIRKVKTSTVMISREDRISEITKRMEELEKALVSKKFSVKNISDLFAVVESMLIDKYLSPELESIEKKFPKAKVRISFLLKELLSLEASMTQVQISGDSKRLFVLKEYLDSKGYSEYVFGRLKTHNNPQLRAFAALFGPKSARNILLIDPSEKVRGAANLAHSGVVKERYEEYEQLSEELRILRSKKRLLRI